MDSIYDFSMTLANGQEQALAEFKGKVLLIVNTASKCGFTPQYDGLQKLQDQYADKGFSVLAFPCDQFGKQEPGSDEEIMSFCTTKFNVNFPVFSKIEVNGDNAAPIYQVMKSSAKGIFGSEGIKWNFTKFLVNAEGEIIKRYAPTTKPEVIAKDIEKQL
ncbi:MAG: glutathione peroxidase [Glaciecola sp.]|jgi:glutathione peroxidase|uniref:glutathione peroxidase n=1 Tax=Glaciecola sp. HTCC2999 TaxID=455436 RepID=UPI0000E116E9|nr:glutathione peroxidase [Glaciecola sp. HTCC2999]